MDKYLNLLKKEVKPALGCTEPIAIAFALAKLKEVYNINADNIDKINLFLSKNIIKNALGVGIPGTGMTGIPISACLGLFAENSSKELRILDNLKEIEINSAKDFFKKNILNFYPKEDSPKLYIEVNITAGKDEFSLIIEENHTNITLIKKNGDIFFIKKSIKKEIENYKTETGIEEIYNYIINVPFEKIMFILEGAEMNKSIALEGLKNNYGLKIGKTLKKNIENNFLADDLKNYAVLLTAAASDARMGGCMLPVMTNSGSGNQGITVTLPVVAVAEKLNKSDEQLARALALSNLIAIHIKNKLGRLSALCGVVVSAIGAGAGIAFLINGKLNTIVCGINNMIGNISGIICDGAKGTCALKIATVTEAAFNSLFLALENIQPSCSDGIIDKNIEMSIDNLTNLGSFGMEEVDRMVFDIMINKTDYSKNP